LACSSVNPDKFLDSAIAIASSEGEINCRAFRATTNFFGGPQHCRS
jgi:hypothetical protein